jgi:hypothetical protein
MLNMLCTVTYLKKSLLTVSLDPDPHIMNADITVLIDVL